MGPHVACTIDVMALPNWRLPCSQVGGDGHVEREVATVHRLNNSIALQGVLALLAFAAFLVVAAHALQVPPDSVWSSGIAPVGAQISTGNVTQPLAAAEPAAVFHGTIVKDGAGFGLRETSGSLHRLAPATNVKAFVGKYVRLTGRMDKDAGLIHIEGIQRGAGATS